ncbi:MAG: dTDP-glucose pyrophosphorylase [Synechococcales cyanobacterium CRU_2_2]|nr:dTDP-glucose pyrophosphorylase [Synechococcales cyanobacterium CRU_2_2]
MTDLSNFQPIPDAILRSLAQPIAPNSPTSGADVIGLIPAGGRATRLSPLPMSKELYPIGFQHLPEGLRPKVVGQYLLERMRSAGIRKLFWIVRSDKWDIPAYFGNGSQLGLDLGYLILGVPFGVPYTLDQAYPFVSQARIALGFPDILFSPPEMFQQLLSHQTKTGADVVLALVPAKAGQVGGRVGFDAIGRVQQILEKPEQTDLAHIWCAAVWAPSFTQFLHEQVAPVLCAYASTGAMPERELPIGDVIQRAIAAGLHVQAMPFPDGEFLDVGIAENLAQAVQYFAAQVSGVEVAAEVLGKEGQPFQF